MSVSSCLPRGGTPNHKETSGPGISQHERPRAVPIDWLGERVWRPQCAAPEESGPRCWWLSCHPHWGPSGWVEYPWNFKNIIIWLLNCCLSLCINVYIFFCLLSVFLSCFSLLVMKTPLRKSHQLKVCWRRFKSSWTAWWGGQSQFHCQCNSSNPWMCSSRCESNLYYLFENKDAQRRQAASNIPAYGS